MAECIGYESGKRCNAIRHRISADRTQRKEIIKCQCGVADRDEDTRNHDDPDRFCPQRRDDLVGLDISQQLEQDDGGNENDQHADGDADSVPVKSLSYCPRDDARHVWHGNRAMSVDSARRITAAVSHSFVTPMLHVAGGTWTRVTNLRRFLSRALCERHTVTRLRYGNRNVVACDS